MHSCTATTKCSACYILMPEIAAGSFAEEHMSVISVLWLIERSSDRNEGGTTVTPPYAVIRNVRFSRLSIGEGVVSFMLSCIF